MEGGGVEGDGWRVGGGGGEERKTIPVATLSPPE